MTRLSAALAIGVTAASGSAEADDTLWIPITRLAMGSAFHVGADEGLVGFALDATAGATWMPEIVLFGGGEALGPVLNFEGGYLYDGFADDLHAFHVTAGVGYGAFFAGALYQPRLVVGTVNGGTAIGMRNGLRVYAPGELVSFEIAHQFVHHDGALAHDVHLLIGVSPWVFVAVD